MSLEKTVHYIKKAPRKLVPAKKSFTSLVMELFFSLIVGFLAGTAGILFYHAIAFATGMRTGHPWLLYLLPFGGLLIVFLYRLSGHGDNKGTNLILLAIHRNEPVSILVAPLIFIASFITHLFGGSSGREGAALQIGGSIGDFLAGLFHFDNEERHLFIMCGMSACFSAVFGTPLAAAIFSLEVFDVGIMHYTALLPCVIASLTASVIAKRFGALPEAFSLTDIPAFGFLPGGKILLLSLIIAACSVFFCMSLHSSEKLYKKLLPNPYIRIFTGGALIILMVFIFRTRDYIGAGMPVIERCFEGNVPIYVFLLKILFTAVTLGAGYKGGEIVPAFFTGATLGCALGPLFSLPPSLCAACGMVGLFCGVTNCPVTSIFIALELFGMDAMPYFLISAAISFMLSGYYSLYGSQKIYYSKYKHRVIDRSAH